MFWVYMLRCADGTIYTGTAADVDKRAAVHNAGKGAKYTKPRLPVEVIYREQCADRPTALRRELELKKLPRAQKQQLAEEFKPGEG